MPCVCPYHIIKIKSYLFFSRSVQNTAFYWIAYIVTRPNNFIDSVKVLRFKQESKNKIFILNNVRLKLLKFGGQAHEFLQCTNWLIELIIHRCSFVISNKIEGMCNFRILTLSAVWFMQSHAYNLIMAQTLRRHTIFIKWVMTREPFLSF